MPKPGPKIRAARAAIPWLCAAAVFGCQDSAGPADGARPEMPPVASMQMDLSYFAQAGGEPAASSMVGLNWTAAAIRVGVANLGVSLVLAVPVATWGAAAAQTPTVESGKWHWRFSAQQGSATYGSHVTGYLDGAESVWEMRVTSSPLGLNEFLWFDGRARVDGESGYWAFHDPATNSGADVGRIEWTHPAANTWTLRFTDTNGASVNLGDRLDYGVSGNARTVTFFDASTGQAVEVGWDAVLRTGWLIAPGYNNGQKACWDSALNDVACG